jgi:hypothetical protein
MRKAVFSQDEVYRYTLWREWGGMLAEPDCPYVNFICLNPSTATDTKDDNTMRKCIKFSRAWGYDAMCVTNIFAFRSTDPAGLLTTADPIGPLNNGYIYGVAKYAGLVIAAWSQHGGFLGRSTWVRQILRGFNRPIYYLRMGEGKHPEPYHPLYLLDVTKPVLWENI